MEHQNESSTLKNHYLNKLTPEETISLDKAMEFEKVYVELLQIAKDEYEYKPTSTYYRGGFNLYKRLGDYKDNHLLFLVQ